MKCIENVAKKPHLCERYVDWTCLSVSELFLVGL
jgi:hypothetical protein